jgi:two-component system cell cycle response regulator DivK
MLDVTMKAPVQAMNAEEPTDSPAPAPTGKLLCIEDDETSMAIVEAMMKRFADIRLTEATNGADGIRLARAERPDLVLLDMHLPDMSGLEVVRQLNPDIAANGLRVIILTGDPLTMDVIKAMSLGAFEYWVKPLTLGVLESGIQRALAARRPSRRYPPK